MGEGEGAGAGESKILILGGTGYIGKFIVQASAKSNHPTYALVRDLAPANSAKAHLLKSFKDSGVTLVQGDLYDHRSLVEAFKQVDVVVSTVGFKQLADQVKIIDAIKEAGTIKRFFPSEFGNDVDRTSAVEPVRSAFATKAKVRRAVEAAAVPYTYVSSNYFAGYFLPNLAQAGEFTPPTEKVTILGDGNTKAIFVNEEDIGAYVVKAVDDPRTLNKTLYIRPPANVYSFNDLVSLWEKKIGKTLQKTYLSEQEVLHLITESPFPVNMLVSLNHAVFVKGDHTNFEIEPPFGVEASQLYPEVKYTTVDEYLSSLL